MRRFAPRGDVRDRGRRGRERREFRIARRPCREAPRFLRRHERRHAEAREPIGEEVDGGPRLVVAVLRIDDDDRALEVAELREKRAVRRHVRPAPEDERVGVAVDREMERAEPRTERRERRRDREHRARPPHHELREHAHHGDRASGLAPDAGSRTASDPGEASRFPSGFPPKTAFLPSRARSPTVAVGR